MRVPKVQERKPQGPRKVKWFKLKDRDLCARFKMEVLQKIEPEIDDVNAWWNRTKKVLLETGKDVLGESRGKIWENKETWWFNEEVQEATKLKKQAKKKWEGSQLEKDRLAYRERNKEAKNVVAITKGKAYDQLYRDLETKEGQGRYSD